MFPFQNGFLRFPIDILAKRKFPYINIILDYSEFCNKLLTIFRFVDIIYVESGTAQAAYGDLTDKKHKQKKGGDFQ